jgi:DNA-binding MarR family transcriptional regulator
MNGCGRAGIIAALERATHAVALWDERAFGDLGLTQAEIHVLGHLANVEECSINELHLSFGHKRSTLTSILDRIEKHGLIRRQVHPRSRRSVLVVLTDEGRIVAEHVGDALEAVEAAIARRAGAGDIEAFFRVIASIEESIR